MPPKHHKVALITGAARRIGACIAEVLHANNYNVVVHYRHSRADAEKLVGKLNQARKNSAITICADLDDVSYEKLISDAYHQWKRLDVLINNASSFAPTPMGEISEQDWNGLLNSNLKAPLFLSQAASKYLRGHHGNIINITDIHAKNPMKNYTVYSIAKAGLHMLTKSLALEFSPDIRVNAVAPGSVIWPEGINEYSEEKKVATLSATLLKKQVDPKDIASTVLFLATQTSMTGQIITVDAGRIR